MNTWRTVEVESIRHVAKGVLDLSLAASDDKPLPIALPGAHVDLRMPDGLIRQYSVHDCSDGRYHLGIGLSEPSRGGSLFIHEHLRQGDKLEVSAPRNLFNLDTEAKDFLFIAGGIGITPILSMVRWCKAHNRNWKLLYCTKNRERTAYLDELELNDNVQFHFSEESGNHADIHQYVSKLQPMEHLYCCGPGQMMDAVEKLFKNKIEAARLHFERFKAPEINSDNASIEKSFRAILSISGKTIDVPPHLSLLDSLENSGISIPFACREGMCRTCECKVLDGEVDHRDYVLEKNERDSNTVILPCVSRAKSDEIIIEI